jgi:nucleotide-binding universal stress UspA family protein
MKRFKNILYFADGAQARCSALQRAVALAAANEARLTLFDVVAAEVSKSEIQRRWNLDLESIERASREAMLRELMAGLGNAGTQVAMRVAEGIAFVEVVRAVLQDQFDLVIKAARPPDSFVERSLGSTDLHLLRKCPCPIWIDRRGAPVPYRTILAAVDPSDQEQEESARLILDLASSLAAREDASLAVVHAWNLPGESLLRSDESRLSSSELAQALLELRARHADMLGAMLNEYEISIDDERVHLLKGDPAAVIRAASRDLAADLVVMGTIGRRGIPGYFIGTTAEEILYSTHASVLAIKPTGFASPITTE